MLDALREPAVASSERCSSTVLLGLRLVGGLAFILHGWGKIQDPLGWMGPDSPVPAVFQALAAVAEFGGGIAWMLGLLTRLAAAGIGFTMLGAIYFHAVVRGDPFVAKGGASYELALVYFAVAMLFVCMGAGRYSLDAKLKR